MSKFKQAFIIFLILTFSIFLYIKNLQIVSATYDEDFSYVRNSIYLVKHLRWDQPYITLHPPLMYYLHGWPYIFLNPEKASNELFIERLAILPIYILFGILLFHIAKKLVSNLAAFITLFLYAFNIEILAHSRLVTADFIQAVCIFLAVIAYCQYLKSQSKKMLILTAFLTGMTFIAKYSGLLLLPLFLLILLFSREKMSLKKGIYSLIIIIFSAVLIIHSAYFFKESGFIPSAYQNQLLQTIYRIPILRIVLYIFPRAYLEGLDLQLKTSQSIWWGYFAGKQYINGLWYFYPMAFLLKTQIPLLLLTLFSALIILKKKILDSLDRTLILSIFFFIIYFSLFNKLIIGLRYLLMIYPLIFLFVSKSIDYYLKKKSNIKILLFLVATICIYCIQAFKISPHFLAYANEFIGGPKNSYKYFADSNLDWNQNTILFTQYLREHPETIVNPRKPTQGKIAIDVNEMNLYYYQNYQWLRKLKREPNDNIGYTWLIFDIKPEELFQ